MAGTQRFQKAAFRANPCIISTGVEPSHGHRKSSTMQWTEAPSGRAMRGIFNSFGFQLQISKPIIEQSEEKWRVEYPPDAPWPADRGVASSRGVLHETRKAWRVECDGLDECGRRGRVRQRVEAWGYSALWLPEGRGRNVMVTSSWLLANTTKLIESLVIGAA